MTVARPAPLPASPAVARPVPPAWTAALPAAVVALAFLATALIVPVLAPVAIGDDWVYVRSVEILLRSGTLRILDLSVVTLVAQVFWGALFGALFGPSFGVLRLATVIVTLLGGLATYGVARELGATPGLSALAMAALLFNPLAFVLAYTFMTDPYFTAVMMIATYGYARALRLEGSCRWRWLVAGSALAAVAFLVRQQGVLIPAAVLTALLLQGRLRPNREGLRLVLGVTGLPVLAVLGYYLWLYFVHGVPEQQTEFTARVLEAGPLPTVLLVIRMAFICLMYSGLFTLPITIGALAALPRAAHGLRGAGIFLGAAMALVLAAGLWHFNQLGYDLPPMPRMPYLPQYLGPAGLGPSDLVGIRPWLVSWESLTLLTSACAASVLGGTLLVARRFQPAFRGLSDRGPALMVLVMLLFQVAGTLPPSFHFRDWILSVDRYLLPLLPLALCLLAWAVAGLPFSRTGAWLVVGLVAWVSVAGTRDSLMYQSAVWEAGRRLYAAGVPLTAIDAGAAWDGYYLYEYSIANNIDQQTPGGPWWTDLFGPATTSAYIVSMSPVDGYNVVEYSTVPTWLTGEPSPLYVLQRQSDDESP